MNDHECPPACLDSGFCALAGCTKTPTDQDNEEIEGEKDDD